MTGDGAFCGPLERDDPAALWEQKPPGYPALRYDPEWAAQLHALVQERLGGAGTPVELLDCCCGSGNPTLGLALRHRSSYRLTWSDGDAAMLRRFHANARHHGATLHAEQVAWERLDEHYGEQRFDAVVCVGNSLIYADSWRDRPFHAARARSAVAATLTRLFRVLRRGGVLFVDTTDAGELARDQTLWGQGGWRDQPGGEHIVSRDFVTTVDLSRALRRVVNYRHRYHRASGAYLGTARCEFNGLALGHDALLSLMEDAGFRDAAPVTGPSFPWPLFTGQRP